MQNPDPSSLSAPEFQFTVKTGSGSELEDKTMNDENSNNATAPGNTSL